LQCGVAPGYRAALSRTSDRRLAPVAGHYREQLLGVPGLKSEAGVRLRPRLHESRA